MKICIILDFLDVDQFTGIPMCAYNLTKNILEIDNKNEYYLLHSKNTQLDIYKHANEIILPLNYSREIRYSIQIPFFLRKYNFDVVFTPEHFPPLFMQKKTLLIIHDLSPLIYPDTRQYPLISKLKHKYLFGFLLKIFTKKIITVSMNTKNDLIRYLNISGEKITVIYNGLNEPFIAYRNDISLEKTIPKFNLPKHFLLCVATLEPRKNILMIIEAYHKLKKMGFEQKLVLVGKKGWKYNNIHTKIKQFGLENEVVFTGYVSDRDLSVIYHIADVFIYPSLYEGFGFPPLEAMACGCPVITSDSSSLPEVVGNAAIKINPRDINELTDAIEKLLVDPNLRDIMIIKGIKQAQKFRWNETAKEYIKIFNAFGDT